MNEAFVAGVVEHEPDRPARLPCRRVPRRACFPRRQTKCPPRRRRPRCGSSPAEPRAPVFLLPLGKIGQPAIDAAQRGGRHHFDAAYGRLALRDRLPRTQRGVHARTRPATSTTDGRAASLFHRDRPLRISWLTVVGARRAAYGLRGLPRPANENNRQSFARTSAENVSSYDCSICSRWRLGSCPHTPFSKSRISAMSGFSAWCSAGLFALCCAGESDSVARWGLRVARAVAIRAASCVCCTALLLARRPKTDRPLASAAWPGGAISRFRAIFACRSQRLGRSALARSALRRRASGGSTG